MPFENMNRADVINYTRVTGEHSCTALVQMQAPASCALDRLTRTRRLVDCACAAFVLLLSGTSAVTGPLWGAAACATAAWRAMVNSDLLLPLLLVLVLLLLLLLLPLTPV